MRHPILISLLFQALASCVVTTRTTPNTVTLDFEGLNPLGTSQIGFYKDVCVENINSLGPLASGVQITGIKPHGSIFAAFDFIRGSTVETGPKRVTVNRQTCPNAVPSKFSMTSICVGCLLSTQVPLEGVAQACTFTLQGYSADASGTETVKGESVDLEFNPTGLNNNLYCANVDIKDVTSVDFSVSVQDQSVLQPVAGAAKLVLAGILDDVVLKWNS